MLGMQENRHMPNIQYEAFQERPGRVRLDQIWGRNTQEAYNT